ncbi:perlucin [Biomphalaria glabrata]|nr:perlucin [Biomphalaria glabrata]
MQNLQLSFLFLYLVMIISLLAKERCVSLQGFTNENLSTQERKLVLNCTATLPCREKISSVTFMGILRLSETSSELLAFTNDKHIAEKSGNKDILGLSTDSFFNANGESYLSVSYKQDSNAQPNEIDCIVRGFDSSGELVIMSDTLKYKPKICSDKNENIKKYCSSTFSYNKRKYCFSNLSIANVSEAISYCNLMGGYLAEIDNRDEYLVIQSQFNDAVEKYPDLMIGGTDAAKEGTWIYQNSLKPVSYFDWSQQQPDNSQGREHCLELKRMYNSRMNDEPCFNLKHNFACEIPAE